MEISKIKIVTDSSSDIIGLEGIDFASAPLKIITEPKEYTDDPALDVREMVEELHKYSGKSSTSCPNVNDWLEAFGEAEYIFCIAITATLSGSYNSAMLAKAMYEEEHPSRRVYVLNSLTAGPEIALAVRKMQELIEQGREFDEVCAGVDEYIKKTGLLFMLESMKNLANNGRVSPLVAKMAGLLGIRVVGKASDRGDLEPLNKCRGEQKALETIVGHMKSMGLRRGQVRIAHCFNEAAAKRLLVLIKKDLPHVEVEIVPCRGLCSFYAEKGGMLVGFEKL